MGGQLSLREVAALVGGTVFGDPEHRVMGLRSLGSAQGEHLSFLANRRYLRDAQHSQAGAILVAVGQKLAGRGRIEVADPYLAFARMMKYWHPYTRPVAKVDARAWVAEDAVVDGARIEAFAWIGPGAVVGPGTWVETGAVVGSGTVIGSDCRLMPKSVVMDGCVVGDRVWLNPGAVVGGEGFGFAPSEQGHIKIPQAGNVSLGDDVELGANTCVDRGALGTTYVRSGAKLDNLVQVGHGADIGDHSLLIAFSGVAGTSRLGRGVVLAAKAAVMGHLKLGDGVMVGVASAVTSDVEAGQKVSGIPAIPHRGWLRSVTAFAQLPSLLKTVRALEKRIQELENSS